MPLPPTTFRFPWSCCHHRLAAAWALVLLTAVCGCVSDPFRAATLSTAAVMLPQETEVIPAAIIPAGEMPAAEASSGVVQASYESDILLEATAVDAALPDPDTDALTLNDCITIAMRRQPRLQVELENVTRASLAGDISSAAFLPLVSAGYSVGEFGVNVGGIGIPIPGAPAAQGTYVPQQGFLPIGFDYNTTYVLTEARIQWLITDFGRRLGVHRQAGLAEEISRLKSARARQTVAHEVTLAYYELLRAESLFDIADESVARLESELKTIRKLKQGGLLEKEKVLRAEVALSKALKLRKALCGKGYLKEWKIDSGQRGSMVLLVPLRTVEGAEILKENSQGRGGPLHHFALGCIEAALASEGWSTCREVCFDSGSDRTFIDLLAERAGEPSRFIEFELRPDYAGTNIRKALSVGAGPIDVVVATRKVAKAIQHKADKELLPAERTRVRISMLSAFVSEC